MIFLTAIKVTANVPGSIYTDLIRNGILNQDPYFGKNDITYRWVANDNWTFVKTFHGKKKFSKFRIYFILFQSKMNC